MEVDENVAMKDIAIVEVRADNDVADIGEDSVPEVGRLIEQLNKAFCSRTILEHHLAFANDCVSHSIYHLGLQTFVPSVAHRADDALKRIWKQVLSNTSLELLAFV